MGMRKQINRLFGGEANEGQIMAQTGYTVEGRQFRTKSDYTRALHDKKIIDRIRQETDLEDVSQLAQLKKDISNGKYSFLTLLEQDFIEEIDEHIQKVSGKKQEKLDGYVQKELKLRERRRKLTVAVCSLIAAGCLGYLGIYSYFNQRTDKNNHALSELKERPAPAAESAIPTAQFTLDEEQAPPEVLDEFKNLLNINKKLIGWVKIDDTNIDYPVMQTTDNEYYLDHNLNQEYDKNGSIFLDKDCDIVNPSTNLILYGHHMRSGKMFGGLDKYEKQSYWEEHPFIQFDTLYERGTWQVMYVFRSRVYSQEEIVFKYYQFIDVNSEQEFDSNMQEMAAMSLYDTGVTAEYGDRLLTLSTCDYEETNGRFVIVAKKVATKE